MTARRASRVEIVAAHLLQRGHISEGTALIEYGRFRLGDAIHRLRNERRDLIPEGKEIVTVHKKDTQGNPYGEYHLVETRAAASRAAVERGKQKLAQLRADLDTTHGRLAYRDELSLLGSLGPLGG